MVTTTRKRRKPAAKPAAPVKRRKPSTTTAARPRKRVTRKPKGMLSELFNPAMAQAAGKTVISGAIGGAGAVLLNKMLPDMDEKKKAFICIGGGFVAATVLKMPNVGAGMAGVGMYQLMQSSGFLQEDDVMYADPIEQLPLVLNEDGAAYLQDGGGMYLQEDGMYLQDGSEYQVGYFPNFGM